LATEGPERRPVVEPPNGHHRSQYDPEAAQVVLSDAAGLLKALGPGQSPTPRSSPNQETIATSWLGALSAR
jgi:hypothetical protein